MPNLKNREDFLSRHKRYSRIVHVWNVCWAILLPLIIFVASAGIGAAKALASSDGEFVAVCALLVSGQLILIHIYGLFLVSLPKRMGLACPNCGKGLAGRKNRDVSVTGKCGLCGVTVFDSVNA